VRKYVPLHKLFNRLWLHLILLDIGTGQFVRYESQGQWATRRCGACELSSSDGPELGSDHLDEAIDQTDQGRKNRDEAIHDVRVATNKLRALLRLARGKSDDDVFARELHRYHKAGQRLSDLRDAAVMILVSPMECSKGEQMLWASGLM
jgi:hypothetical protein